MAKRKKKVNTRRVCYGEWKANGEPATWLVRVKPATSRVEFDSTIAQAMSGHAGRTVGCHLSICAQNHPDVFPHNFLLASFTKSTAIIITKMVKRKSAKRFWDAEGVLYAHSHRYLVNLNDYDKGKEFLRKNPDVAERKIYLRPPRVDATGTIVEGKPVGKPGLRFAAHAPRGALARAITAGLIDKSMTTVLREGPA